MTFERLRAIEGKDKEKILEQLNREFGITKIPGILLMRGSERIFLYQGNLTMEEISNMEKTFVIERIGVYFAKEQNGEVRLSLEGVHLIKDQITKGIFELDEKQADEWMHGSELNLETGKKGFLIMKYQDYFLGTGKASLQKISNYIPKNRRLKFKG
jgi:NOL1/NOP2/fmu family ribosome biogenesis protein